MQKLDQAWYQTFLTISNVGFLESLDGERDEREHQKKLFLDEKIENPHFTYPFINPEKVKRERASLQALKHTLQEQEHHEGVRQAYLFRLEEELVKTDFLEAVLLADGATFQHCSEYLYGRPRKTTFYDVVAILHEQLAPHLKSSETALREATGRLFELLPILHRPPERFDLGPSPELFAAAKEEVSHTFARILSIVANEPQNLFDAPAMKQVFETIFAAIGIKGWKVVISQTSKVAINVSQQEKTVYIPASRSAEKAAFTKLVLHEIGAHVLRNIHGENSPLLLLGVGLDRYEACEEGVATLYQQLLDDSFTRFAGLRRYLSIGLVYGIDSFPRSFRETYTILEAYCQVRNLLDGASQESAKGLAREEAWYLALRTFRGTDGSPRGICFTKDLIYREGNIEAWKMLRDDLKALSLFQLGKFNPRDKNHCLILREMGILKAP